jgi:hypothetical protein
MKNGHDEQAMCTIERRASEGGARPKEGRW